VPQKGKKKNPGGEGGKKSAGKKGYGALEKNGQAKFTEQCTADIQ